MKKILFFVACICLISSCSNDNEVDDNGNGNAKTDKLSKTTIQNAKYIYGISDKDTRGLKSSTNENSFWMVDNDGNVEAIRFITESGAIKDMNIRNIFDVNDKYIIMAGDFQMEFVDKTDVNNGDDDDISPTTYAHHILVNKETGALYNFPFYVYDYMGEPQFYTDAFGSFYFSDYQMIYKATVSKNGNIEVENYIPENQRLLSFIVNSNGICVINPNEGVNCKFKLPNGRMYSLQHFTGGATLDANIFIGFNNQFYIAYPLDSKLQIIELVENNGELNSKEITKTDISIYSQILFVQNHVRGTHVTLTHNNILLEFDEKTGHLNEHAYSNFPSNETYFSTYYISSRTLYVNSVMIDLNTYELQGVLDFFDNGYEVNKISISKNSPDVSFSGLRYSDGKNVIGVVDENGVFNVNESTKAESEITTLIRLN